MTPTDHPRPALADAGQLYRYPVTPEAADRWAARGLTLMLHQSTGLWTLEPTPPEPGAEPVQTENAT